MHTDLHSLVKLRIKLQDMSKQNIGEKATAKYYIKYRQQLSVSFSKNQVFIN